VAKVMDYRPGPPGPTGKGVALVERMGFQMVQVSTWPTTSDGVSQILAHILGVRPPEQPNTVSSRDPIKIFWFAPNRWLVVRPAKSHPDLASELTQPLPANSAAVVELGAGRCIFTVSGPRSRDILAKQLPIDLSKSRFPAGRCAHSAIAHIGVLVHAESEDAFEILVYRSYARHLWEVLTDAALEFRSAVP
jgi:heterotetrameric sarcosine oxidase gamma subunit